MCSSDPRGSPGDSAGSRFPAGYAAAQRRRGTPSALPDAALHSPAAGRPEVLEAGGISPRRLHRSLPLEAADNERRGRRRPEPTAGGGLTAAGLRSRESCPAGRRGPCRAHGRTRSRPELRRPRRSGRGRVSLDVVASRSPVEPIRSLAAAHGVVARAAPHLVVPGFAEQAVDPGEAAYPVVSGTAIDRVPARSAVEPIGARPTKLSNCARAWRRRGSRRRWWWWWWWWWLGPLGEARFEPAHRHDLELAREASRAETARHLPAGEHRAG